MKKLQAQITTRLVAAMLVTAAVIGLSALAMHAPTQNQNSLTRSLKSIQTDKATLFYAWLQRHSKSCCLTNESIGPVPKLFGAGHFTYWRRYALAHLGTTSGSVTLPPLRA